MLGFPQPSGHGKAPVGEARKKNLSFHPSFLGSAQPAVLKRRHRRSCSDALCSLKKCHPSPRWFL